MDQPPRRRFTLADAAILIAASAVAMQWTRMIHGPRPGAGVPGTFFWVEIPMGFALGISAAPFLIAGSAALLVARLRGPRPRVRKLAGQPGTLACLVLLVHFPAFAALDALNKLRRHLQGLPDPDLLNLGEVLGSTALGGVDAVAAAWLTLALVGRWRPVPDWIDRSGRVVGVASILVAAMLRVLA